MDTPTDPPRTILIGAGMAQLWDAATAKELTRFMGDGDPVLS
ncbi:MAG: hypothetical protein ACR2PF_02180 [Rhizobiaceae bacterium]